MSGLWRSARVALPPPATGSHARGGAGRIASGVERGGAPRGPRRVAASWTRRPHSAAALLDEERYLCSVRRSGCESGGSRAAEPTASSRLREAGTVGGTESGLELGHNEAEGPAKVDLLLLGDLGHLQPPGGGLDGGCESSGLAKKLIRESCDKHRIEQDQLTLHADRGSSMKSKVGALLLSDLGVTKTHSRPHVSDDVLRGPVQNNGRIPERFGASRMRVLPRFFGWYNNVHYRA